MKHTRLMPFVGLLVFGLSISSSLGVALAQSRDCGSDWGCITDAAARCDAATMVANISTTDELGTAINRSDQYEIIPDGSGCRFTIRSLSGSVTYSERAVDELMAMGLPREGITQMEADVNQALSAQAGMGLTCQFPSGDLAAMLGRWATSTFAPDDLAPGQCEPLTPPS